MQYNDLIPEFIVSDIEKSRYFYTQLLGFKVEYERPEDKFIFLSLGGIQLMIEQGSPTDLSILEYPFGRGANYSFGVDNVEEVYQRLLDANYPIHKELVKREFRVGDTWVTPIEFSILDPDGYLIRVSS